MYNTEMNTIFMNSNYSKTSGPHRPLFNLTDRIKFKKVINMLLYQILTCNVHEKIEQSHIRTINLKYQLQHVMKNLNCLMDHILCQIFKINLSISLKIW